MAEKTTEDVDLLFACFKCGISPPQSAMRVESTRRKRRTLAKASRWDVTSNPFELSPGTISLTNLDQSQVKSRATSSRLLAENSALENGNGQGRRRKSQISPTVFYGSPFGVPPKRPISLLRLLREIRADVAQQDKDTSGVREELWVTFPRQNEAMNFAKEQGGNVRLFCYQDHHNGQRRFLVSTYYDFWKRYSIMDPKFRHHYEVIQEDLPCHLYFDLEFSTKENPTCNGDEMVDILVSIIFEMMQEKYSIEGDREWITELDSSTSEKFSRHLIIHIPNTAFKDNSHVGAFVTEVCSRVVNAKVSNPLLQKLFIKKDPDESMSYIFIDTAVYSRNRCFRLALSSKAGKTSVLLPTGRFISMKKNEEEFFMSSLICCMDRECSKLLICKMDEDCVKKLQFDTEVNHDITRYRNPQLLSSNGSSHLVSSMGRSPFPDLDNFIESIASNGSVSGKIRSWYWLSEHELMVYSMLSNRYCERIGREHKSNHVIYVVDLRKGIFYQKCHDPDCQGYRSPFRPIPLHMALDHPSSYEQLKHASELSRCKPQYELDDEDGANHMPCGGDNTPLSSGKDSWWLEVVRVADGMETINQIHPESDEDDESWWSSVESSLLLAELAH